MPISRGLNPLSEIMNSPWSPISLRGSSWCLAFLYESPQKLIRCLVMACVFASLRSLCSSFQGPVLSEYIVAGFQAYKTDPGLDMLQWNLNLAAHKYVLQASRVGHTFTPSDLCFQRVGCVFAQNSSLSLLRVASVAYCCFHDSLIHHILSSVSSKLDLSPSTLKNYNPLRWGIAFPRYSACIW